MPIYEYQCAACGRVVEKWQKLSEDPLAACPQCGGSMSKLISNCAFHLKGSGWYVSDYAGSRQGLNQTEPPAEGGDSQGTAAPDQAEASPPPKVK